MYYGNVKKANLSSCLSISCTNLPSYFESTHLWLYKYDLLKLHENDKKTYCWLLERLRFAFTANGKRQTQVENFSE